MLWLPPHLKIFGSTFTRGDVFLSPPVLQEPTTSKDCIFDFYPWCCINSDMCYNYLPYLQVLVRCVLDTTLCQKVYQVLAVGRYLPRKLEMTTKHGSRHLINLIASVVSWLACSPRVWQIVGSSRGRVKIGICCFSAKQLLAWNQENVSICGLFCQ